MRNVDPAGCEVHHYGGGLDSAVFCGWGVGRGRGGSLGKNVGGKEGKTMELPKQPFSVHVAGVKQEYRRAKLSGARYFDVSGKFESFWRLKLYSALVRPTIGVEGLMAENLFVLHAKKLQVLKINVSNSKLRLSIQFKYGSLSYYKQIPSCGSIQMKFQMCLS